MSSYPFEPPRFIDLPGLRLAYREWGSGAETVLLIHGITSSSLSWARVGPALGERYHVLALDLKGHGDTDQPADGYRLEDQAAEVAEWAARLGVARAHVIGHSWGGAIAMVLALSSAGRLVDRLVLEDPALTIESERALGLGEQFATQVQQPEAVVRENARGLPGWTEIDVEGRVDASRKADPGALRAVFAGGGWDLVPRFRELHRPTLLMRAEPELGGIVGRRAVAAFAADVPGGRIVTVPGADHSIHRSQFEAFMDAVEPFLRGD